jgi:tetratricopeptide (TPR) repeat protein
LGDAKWQYRALAQLGIAAFYDADVETARKNVGTALVAATKAGDAGAHIRILLIIANGLVATKMYEQALSYIENALKIASATPDAGYQFTAQTTRIEALIGLRRFDTAQRIIEDVLEPRVGDPQNLYEAAARVLAADIADARNDRQAALATLKQAIALGKAEGLTRLLAAVYARAAETHRKNGDLEKAERTADLAAASTQPSGDVCRSTGDAAESPSSSEKAI